MKLFFIMYSKCYRKHCVLDILYVSPYIQGVWSTNAIIFKTIHHLKNVSNVFFSVLRGQ